MARQTVSRSGTHVADALCRALAGRPLYHRRSEIAASVGQRNPRSSRGRCHARRREYVGSAGSGTRHGSGCRDSRALHGRTLRRVDGAQDLRIHLGRRGAGGDFAGCGTHSRTSGTVELHHVLRFQQHTALDALRRGRHRGCGGQVPRMELGGHRDRRPRHSPDPRRARQGLRRDRASDAHHRPHGHGQGCTHGRGRELRAQGFDPRTASDGCRSRYRRNDTQSRR